MVSAEQAGVVSRIEDARWIACSAAIRAPRRRHDLTLEQLDDEAILLDPRRGDVHRLNQTALLVWRLCDGQTTTREIARQLTTAYQVDFEAALACVDELMVRLATLQLFEQPGNSD